MLKSMTGFGKVSVENDRIRLNIEIRCLNSKQLDIVCKCPAMLREKELEIRGLLGSRLQRGKVEINIFYEELQEQQVPLINKDVVSGYYKQIKELNTYLDNASEENILQLIMKLPDVLKSQRKELKPEHWNEIRSHIEKAVEDTLSFRSQEGTSLEKDLIKRIKLIAEYLKKLSKFEKARIEKLRSRLDEKIKDLNSVDIDTNRFEQELIYYLEKLDITEEKTRLVNHLDYFLENISSDEPVGKKLGFIIQEIGREINTLGSKANDHEIQKLVVKMKDELEKIREQTLNVL